MAKKYYLDRSEEARLAWLKNFAAKLPAHAATYGVTPAEVSAVQAEVAWLEQFYTFRNVYRTFSESLTRYKNDMLNGTSEMPDPLQVPSPQLAGNWPAPGILRRVMSLVIRIKSTIGYKEADGTDMGIEGSTAAASDRALMQPHIRIRSEGEGSRRHTILWTLGSADALEIHKDSGDGQGYRLLAIDTRPDYTDTSAPPAQPAQWRYKAIYIVDGERTGDWSEEQKILVGG